MSETKKGIESVLERRSKRVEIAKNVFEIVALLIGGVWALFFFVLKDVPSLNKEFRGEGTLHIDSFGLGLYKSDTALHQKCDLKYKIGLKNIGSNSLFIDYIDTRIWLLPLSKVDSIEHYLDFNSVIWRGRDTLSSLRHVNNTLVGFYPPETEAIEDFDFVVPINEDSAVLIDYTAHGHGKKGAFFNDTFSVRGYAWKAPCVPQK
jgi:hypothetical protein